MNRPRPSVFIGSSTEGLTIAEAIQQNLDHACDTMLWSQGFFGLGGGTLETLVERLDDYDFAILVLTPDDLVVSRGTKQGLSRDNVLVELGLFIGGIGRKRTFAVYDRTASLKLPSDLAGVTPSNLPTESHRQPPRRVGRCLWGYEEDHPGIGHSPSAILRHA
jgi:predicted nucleotide-binding protein